MMAANNEFQSTKRSPSDGADGDGDAIASSSKRKGKKKVAAGCRKDRNLFRLFARQIYGATSSAK
jgi:hypothetical protein